MKSKLFLQLIICLLGIWMQICPLRAAVVPENEAVEWVNATGYKLIEALSQKDIMQKYQVLDEMFDQNIDTDYMARFVLGKYWRTLDADQQAEFTALFKRYAVSLYKGFPLDFDLQGLGFDVISTQTSGNYTDIVCRIDLPEKYRSDTLSSLPVAFKLSKTAGNIKIIDLKIQESSLLLTYRARFMKMIKDVDEDMTWFLEDFTDLTLSNEKNAALVLENLE